jgi:hypothetical protein
LRAAGVRMSGKSSSSTRNRIAVHFDPHGPQDSYSRRWIDELEKRSVEVLILDFRDPDIMSEIRGCRGAMWHWYHNPGDKQAAPRILDAIEHGLGIPVFPNFPTRWHYDEKVAQYYLLEALDIPRVPSRVFWRREEAFEFLLECRYPVVFKLSVGAGSANVLKLESREEAAAAVGRMFGKGIFPYTCNEYSGNAGPESVNGLAGLRKRFAGGLRYVVSGERPSLPPYYLLQKDYVYLQEFIPGNRFDIRVTVIGNRAFGFIRHNRPDDFRASGSGEIDYDPDRIPLEAVRLAHDISRRCSFQSMAYDFLVSERAGVLLNEISYCYLNTAVHGCPGHWDRDLNWIRGQVWPEAAHVEDFLRFLEHGTIP